MNDQELIEGLKNNHQGAFRKLVDKYQQQVVSTCYYFLRNQDDAQDVGQEVFIEVYQSIHKFRQESSLSTWLYRIASNKSLNLIRKNKYKSLFVNIENLFKEKTSDVQLRSEEFSHAREQEQEYDERVKKLNWAINLLPINQKTAITLHKYSNLSYKEIADVMEISLSAVESLIHRAKVNLQNTLINNLNP
ncbi:MAG: RNA polymerase sigma factor [Bacteroidales bacterium]|nr:RNA polymerase sigma factor [Bacteroidales bacterium]